MANAILWWIVICMLPESLRALDQFQVIKGKLDPQWGKYISNLSRSYDETAPELVETTVHPLTMKVGWTLTRFGESSFSAVIHRNSTSTSPVSLDAGNACGGALVTSDKVITLCTCLATWYNWMSNGAKGSLVPGSVKSKHDIIAEHIYVTYSGIDFVPDFKTKLDNRAKITPKATCPANAADSDARTVNALVVKFAPKIQRPSFGQFMPWPPYPILEDTSHPVKQIAIVMGFGMMARPTNKKFYNEFGEEIPVNISTVRFVVENTPYGDCAKDPSLWRKLPKELSTKVTCFRVTNEKFELCGGLVGSPVLLGGSIHGLMESSIRCDTPTSELLTFSFDAKTRENIENWAGNDLKKNQKVLEDDSTPRHQVFYQDYEVFRRKKGAHSQGLINPVPNDILAVVLHLTILSTLDILDIF